MYESVDIVGLVTWDAESNTIDFDRLPTKLFYRTFNEWYLAATGTQARLSTRCNRSAVWSDGTLHKYPVTSNAFLC